MEIERYEKMYDIQEKEYQRKYKGIDRVKNYPEFVENVEKQMNLTFVETTDLISCILIKKNICDSKGRPL